MRRFVAVTALVLGLAACGGDDDDGAAVDEASDVTDAASTEAPADTDATADSEAPEGTDAPEFEGDADSEFCELARRVEDSEFLEGDDPEQLREEYQDVSEAFDQLRDTAPDEIRDDIQLLGDQLDEFIAVLDEYDFSFTALAEAAADNPELAASLDAVSSPEFEEASDRVDTYVTDVCGISTE
jgi:hypothetical protein